MPGQAKRDALEHFFVGKQAIDEHRHGIFQQQVRVAPFGVEREKAMGGRPEGDDHDAMARRTPQPDPHDQRLVGQRWELLGRGDGQR